MTASATVETLEGVEPPIAVERGAPVSGSNVVPRSDSARRANRWALSGHALFVDQSHVAVDGAKAELARAAQALPAHLLLLDTSLRFHADLTAKAWGYQRTDSRRCEWR